jgi:hypothetical protein
MRVPDDLSSAIRQEVAGGLLSRASGDNLNSQKQPICETVALMQFTATFKNALAH